MNGGPAVATSMLRQQVAPCDPSAGPHQPPSSRLLHLDRRPERARASVTSSVYSMSPPTGMPEGETGHRGRRAGVQQRWPGRVPSPRPRHRGWWPGRPPRCPRVAAIRECRWRCSSGPMPRCGESAAQEDVIEASILAGALDRLDVERLLDHTDLRPIASRSGSVQISHGLDRGDRVADRAVEETSS